MTISISGQVPAEAQNGMVALEDSWTKERTPDPVFAIVKIERHGFKFVDAKQEHAATMKFTHIEPVTADDLETAKAMLDRACRARGGSESTAVELDLEERDVDLDTPLAQQPLDGEPEPEAPVLKAVK